MIFPPFRLDVLNQCIWRGETRLPVMPKPFAVLHHLVMNAGRLVTYDELLKAIWPDCYVQPEVLRQHVLKIRRVLGDPPRAPRFIETIPKRGYRFVASVADGKAGHPDLGGTEGRLVGRRSPLEALDRQFRRALHGQRQIVLVSGEAGVGKTSLADVFVRRAATSAGVHVAWGQCVEGFGSKEPYYPFFEAIARLARSPIQATVLRALSLRAPAWLIHFPSLVRPEQRVSLERGVGGVTGEQMAREFCDMMDVVTHEVTVVLVVDDLQWADSSTLDLLSAIARRPESSKLLILCTVRRSASVADGTGLGTLWHDLLLHRLGHELKVECLEETDIRDYLTVEFDSNDFDPGLALLIHRHSAGNPMFMTAILSDLVRRRLLARREHGWTMTVTLGEIAVGLSALRRALDLQLHPSTEASQQERVA